MAATEVVEAFAARRTPPGDPAYGAEGDALMVDGWWPAALWLGPNTCLVRLDEGPRAPLADSLRTALTGAGLEPLHRDLDAATEAVSAYRLGVVGGRWQAWATSESAGVADISAAAL
ncbi:MAG TPA: hypothetical protein VNT56_07815 [Acidimicrobiales bacterium]|nr:hypothetical protein [Acidimicrobiales bacterium]